MTNRMFQWADLPRELLEMIGTCLDCRVDLLRFRSVCTSWRSAVPPPSFHKTVPPLILNLPPPIGRDVALVPTTVSRLELLHHHTLSSNTNTSSSSSKGWLTKVGASKHGKLQLLHPVTTQEIRHPFQLDLLDVRFVQLCTAFMLGGADRLRSPLGLHGFGLIKVVLFPVSASCTRNRIGQLGVLAIYHEGKLGYWKHGDDKWTLLDENNFQYDDIIEYKGQLYVIDRWGTVSWIDSSLKLIQYSPPLYGCGAQKNLVESSGDLYVVDRYLDGERGTWKDYENLVEGNSVARVSNYRKCNPAAIDFRVYKLDEEWGKWVDVKSLRDRVFVLGTDCSFSVSSDVFNGGKGNCIYFVDDGTYAEKGFSGDVVRLFRLEDRSIKKLAEVAEYSEIFLPDVRFAAIR